MRFYDFLIDIQTTSARIAERRLPLDSDALAMLTLKTLTRPDVVTFFDDLSEPPQADLPQRFRLIYHMFMFAYLVNIRPRPSFDEVVAAAVKVKRSLLQAVKTGKGNKVLCSPRRVRVPSRLTRSLSPFLDINTKVGFYCQYADGPPETTLVERLRRPEVRDAALFLYSGKPAKLPDDIVADPRLIFADTVFFGRDDRINAVYISSGH